MYRVGNRQRNHHKKIVWGAFVIIFLLAGASYGALYVKNHFHIQPQLSQSPAVVTAETTTPAPTKTYNTGIFSIQLPTSWKEDPGETSPYYIFSWEGNVGEPDEELLQIFQDTIPQNMAVNRVLVVSSEGNVLAPIGTVSDNCADFTKNPTTDNAVGIPAKWGGVNFLCDLANTERDVVGTSSTDGVNTVDLTGPTTGSHAFFFTFTDNSIDPDYDDFYNALSTFKLD